MNTLLNDLKTRLVTKDEDLIGHKITDCHLVWSDSLYLMLDDGRFVIIGARRGYEDSVELELKDSVDGWDDLDNLVEIGAIPASDHIQWKADREAENKKSTEDRERAEFEKLRRKFQPEAIPKPTYNQLGWPDA